MSSRARGRPRAQPGHLAPAARRRRRGDGRRGDGRKGDGERDGDPARAPAHGAHSTSKTAENPLAFAGQACSFTVEAAPEDGSNVTSVPLSEAPA